MKYELFFLFLLMIGIFLSVSYFSPGQELKKTSLMNSSLFHEPSQKPVSSHLSYDEMYQLFQQDSELLEMLVNGAIILQGPTIPSSQERDQLPAIYHTLPQNGIYKAMLKYQNHQWLVLFNRTTILKKVVISQLRLG